VSQACSSASVGGTASTLGAQGARLFVGGTFSSAGGVARAIVAAFDVRTGKLLPWRPTADSVVTGLAATNGKIYIEANGQGVILKSPNGSCFEMTVADSGALTTAPAACPTRSPPSCRP